MNNLHFGETVQALTQELETNGLQILLGYTDYSVEREEQLIETMLRRRPEAIVLSYDGHSDRSLQLLNAAQDALKQQLAQQAGGASEVPANDNWADSHVAEDEEEDDSPEEVEVEE